MFMNFADLIQAVSAGICFYAGIVHLQVGLRSQPRERTHLFFAAVSLLWGIYSLAIFALYAAFYTGSLDRYVFVDRVGIALWYLAFAFLYWFIAVYTRADKNAWVRRVLWAITGFYALIAALCFVLPYPWVYTDIKLTDTFPPDIVIAPWYPIEQVMTFLFLITYSAYCIVGQYRRGEKSSAKALGAAVGIYLITVLWDYGIEHGLFDTVLMAQYGFVAFIVIMSLRLSSEAVEAMVEARRLNIELEDRVEERTAALSDAKEAAEAAVKELQESETRLDHVLRSARLAVWEYDLQTRETAVTDAFPHLLGYDPNDILVESGEKWRGYQLGHQSLAAQLLHPDDKQRYAESLGEMIQGKETFEVEYRLRMADGKWNWMRDHGRIVKRDDSGKPLLAYGVIADIDRMKRLQLELVEAKDTAESANRAKSTFLANMSHELRTPLNAILGFAQIMQRDPDMPERERENLEIISHSGEHLLELINDVLEMSKIEAGQSTLDVASFDLYRTLDNLEEMTRIRAEEKGLTLTVLREPTIPRYIRTDERKLRQVLINLLGNAVKFTEDGSVTLHVGTRDGSTDEGISHMATTDEGRTTAERSSSVFRRSSLVFEVEDTGVGIAPGEMDTLFEPFGQTASGRRAVEGSGLGLPISRQFVELMGGDIAVRSQRGQGTTVQFDIQVEEVSAGEVQPLETPQRVIGIAPGQRAADGGAYRVLVVDDSADNRAMLRQMLEPVGFDVQEAVDGQDGVENFESWTPHLVWMDMRMPVMDGYEATRRIKDTATGRATPVIAITASAFEEERTAVLASGCDDLVRKPVKEAEIFAKMGEHLGVEYVYEDLTTPAGETEQVELAPADLAGLPADWLAELRQAAMSGRTRHLLDSIAQIQPDHPALATTLRAMVDEYQFRQIVALTE
jgi:PAS domain S-box-containing protein